MDDQRRRSRNVKTLFVLLAGLATAMWAGAALAQQDPGPSGSPAEQSRQALERGDAIKAVELATARLRQNPHDRQLRLIRAAAYDALRTHREAIDDYDVLLQESADPASLHHLRGRSRFKFGDIQKSILDFDRAIELQPRLKTRLWERGISLYYAERFADGARQFEDYQRYDASDVENVVWRYLCQARAGGAEKARQAILPLDREDPRVPMMTIYALYCGRATPEDVLAAAREGDPGEDELRQRMFYAHLYIGLYFEAESNAEQARHHLRRAHEHKISHYMWDVANVHVAERGWRDAADASSSSAAEDGP